MAPMIMFAFARTGESAMSMINAPFNPWLALMMPFAESFTGPPLERAAGAFESWTQFVTRRFKEDLALGQRLARCRTPIDIQRAYLDFWNAAFDQYGRYYAQLLQDAQPLPPATKQPVIHHRHRAAA
jgi:hypothetical protein